MAPLCFWIGVWAIACQFWPAALEAQCRSQWVSAASVPTQRTEVTGARVGQTIYLIGGIALSDSTAVFTDTVEAYDVRSDSWRAVASLPDLRHHAAAVTVGGKVYVPGGYRDGDFRAVDTLYLYDPSTDRWSTGAPLPTPRGAHTAAAVRGKIYLFGGVGSGGELLGAILHTDLVGTF